MTIESPVNYISDLVAANPAAGDAKSEGDDHIRNIKVALKQSFPNVNGAVGAGHADLAARGSTTVTPNASFTSSTNSVVRGIDGLVTVYIDFTATGASATIGTLPAGYRPLVQMMFPCATVPSASNRRAAIVQIDTAGVITAQRLADGTAWVPTAGDTVQLSAAFPSR